MVDTRYVERKDGQDRVVWNFSPASQPPPNATLFLVVALQLDRFSHNFPMWKTKSIKTIWNWWQKPPIPPIALLRGWIFDFLPMKFTTEGVQGLRWMSPSGWWKTLKGGSSKWMDFVHLFSWFLMYRGDIHLPWSRAVPCQKKTHGALRFHGRFSPG